YDSGSVSRFENFPVTCAAEPVPEPEPEPTPVPEPEPEPAPVDADGDGVIVDNDCNDADATVSVVQTYFHDADGDTLGSATDTTSVCSSVAPAGYVTNTNDTNDNQAYFSAVGTTNGRIIVTYGNGSSSTFQIFAMTTSGTTIVAQYKDSSYLVAISSNLRRIAVVDPYSGAVVASRAMTWRYSVLVNWLVSVIGY
ncbi:MAG: hypothetical protein Q7R41_14305, partial [Phycisphaerales bacterium]|nr:hypothetical protein [Phycisphaerales bacterium]